MAVREDVPVELRCANSRCANPKVTAKQHFCAECHAKQSKTTATTRTVVNRTDVEPVWVAKSNKAEEPVADDEKTKKGQAWARHKSGGKNRFVPDLDAMEGRHPAGKKTKNNRSEIVPEAVFGLEPEAEALNTTWAMIDQDLKEDAWKSNLRMQGLEWDVIEDNLIEE